MQQIQPSAAYQSHHLPAGSLARSLSSHGLKHIGLIVFAVALASAATSSISHGSSAKSQVTQNMQVVSGTSPIKDTNALSTNTPNIKSVGTDPPPVSSNTTVSVNGQSIPIPTQGSTSQTITSGGTKTNIDVTNSSSTTTEDSSGVHISNSFNISVSTTSDSTDDYSN